VSHGCDEHGPPPPMLLLRHGATGRSRFAIVKVVTLAGTVADAVLLIKTNVEPDRRIECAMLIETKPGQFIVKKIRRLRIGEIAVEQSPVCDRACDPMNQLPHRSFASSLFWISPVSDVAVKIF